MSKNEESMNILKRVVIDGILLIALALCIELSFTYWLSYQRGFFCDDETIKYPYKTDTVTVTVLRLVGLIPPIFTFLVCEWYILRKDNRVLRCFGIRIPTWIHGFYCITSSFSFGCCFLELAAIIGKSTIGRLRPHFFDICQPSVNCTLPELRGKYIQPNEYTCTGPKPEMYDDTRRSFPSGHSAWASYTMFYLAFYLEGRMRRYGNHSIRHTLQFIALMLSWFCALSRVSDNKHHWSDVLAGYGLGIVFAILAWVWGTDIVKKQRSTTITTNSPHISVITDQQIQLQNGCN